MRYTAKDLVEAAHGLGYTSVTPRLVVDWTQRGLIDQPRKEGRGPGGGRGTEKGTWSEVQRALFLREVDHHHAKAHKIATLCNLPVFVWLAGGDEAIPTRQVIRAMRTYADAYRTSSMAASRITAKAVISGFGDPGGSREQRRLRQDFIELLATMGPRGGLTQRQRRDLILLGRRVFAPSLQATSFARELPEKYVQIIEARMIALERLADLQPRDFLWARHVYVIGRAEVAQQYPRLAAEPEIALRFPLPDLQAIANTACLDLLTVMGLVELAMEETDPVIGATFDPARSPYRSSFDAHDIGEEGEGSSPN